MKPAVNYRDIEKLYSVKRHLRSLVRDWAVFTLSAFSKGGLSGNWIRFLCYHHIFDDEKRGFARHLRFFKKQGEFISVDDAVDLLSAGRGIKGRYFCVTFDDGFKNCATNALPVLVENKCKAIFFVSTDYVGCDVRADEETVRRFLSLCGDAYPLPVEFLTWDDCRMLVRTGMAVGSHSSSHMPFNRLTGEEIKSEIIESKQKIERELGAECRHFCCPWGVPGRFYEAETVPDMAREAGYKSFFTALRGANFAGTDPFRIRRDHMLANWGNYQLRYFLSR